jgi:SpoVK/Ycf46/Vps4 family AAA+-type ATPase
MEDVSNFNENRYYLTDREKDIFTQIAMAKNTNEKLSEMRIKYLNTTLLYGESGTGKTTFGKYVAYKLGMPFAYLNFAQCISSYLGATSKNIEKVFDYISKQKCVLMLDEIDAIGIKRGKEDLGEMSRIVIGLMQSFDLLENDLIIIGATNRRDMIDEALIRRFTIQHEVTILNNNEAYNLIIKYLEDLKINYNDGNIKEYVKTHHKQSEIIKDIVKSIVKMINNETNFIL